MLLQDLMESSFEHLSDEALKNLDMKYANMNVSDMTPDQNTKADAVSAEVQRREEAPAKEQDAMKKSDEKDYNDSKK